MPEFRGLNVNVVSGGQKLKEWGVQYLDKRRKVSAYIGSTANVKFHLTIQPKLPWNAETYESEGSNFRRSQRTSAKNSHKEPLEPPPYSFVASLYLDGRETPSKRTIIYLNPARYDTAEAQQVSMKSRWVGMPNGILREHHWMFRERTIDAGLCKLSLREALSIGEQNEDALAEALETVGSLDSDLENLRASSRVGQIVVDFSRIVVGRTRVDPSHFSSSEDEGNKLQMGQNDRDIIHAAALVPSDNEAYNSMRVIDVAPYGDDEVPFATFQFFYRTKHQLAKYGFPGFQVSRISTLSPLQLSSAVADMTPLSFRETRSHTDQTKAPVRRQSHEDKPTKEETGKRQEDATASITPHTTKSEQRKREGIVAGPFAGLEGLSQEIMRTQDKSVKAKPALNQNDQASLRALNPAGAHEEGQVAHMSTENMPLKSLQQTRHTDLFEDSGSEAEQSEQEPVVDDHGLEAQVYPSNADEDRATHQWLRSQLQSVSLGKRAREERKTVGPQEQDIESAQNPEEHVEKRIRT